jgi:UDP-N-acetylglucosamine 4,6-dehydratase
MKTGILPITDPRMTRFWITLDQGVHFVLNVLEQSKGGEIFVPKIPSMKITDLGQAIGPDCKQEIVGIRPGEKLHESLIGEDEGRNTFEHKNYYVVLSESYQGKISSQSENGGKLCMEGFKYTSDKNPQLISIEKLRIILEQVEDDYSIEKTRWSTE